MAYGNSGFPSAENHEEGGASRTGKAPALAHGGMASAPGGGGSAGLAGSADQGYIRTYPESVDDPETPFDVRVMRSQEVLGQKWLNSAKEKAKKRRTDGGEGGASRNGKAAASSHGDMASASAGGGPADQPPLPMCGRCSVDLSEDDGYWCKTCCSTYTNISDVLPVELLSKILYCALGRFEVGEFLPVASSTNKSTMRIHPMVGPIRRVCKSWMEVVDGPETPFENAVKVDWEQDYSVTRRSRSKFKIPHYFSSSNYKEYHALVAMEQLYVAASRPHAKGKTPQEIFGPIIHIKSMPLVRFLMGYISIFGNVGKQFLKSMASFMEINPMLSEIMDATSELGLDGAVDLKLKRQYTWFMVITIGFIGFMNSGMLSRLHEGKNNIVNIKNPEVFLGKGSADPAHVREVKIYQYFEKMGHLLDKAKEQGSFFARLVEISYDAYMERTRFHNERRCELRRQHILRAARHNAQILEVRNEMNSAIQRLKEQGGGVPVQEDRENFYRGKSKKFYLERYNDLEKFFRGYQAEAGAQRERLLRIRDEMSYCRAAISSYNDSCKVDIEGAQAAHQIMSRPIGVAPAGPRGNGKAPLNAPISFPIDSSTSSGGGGPALVGSSVSSSLSLGGDASLPANFNPAVAYGDEKKCENCKRTYSGSSCLEAQCMMNPFSEDF